MFLESKTNLYFGNFAVTKVFYRTNTLTAGAEIPALTYDNSLSTLYLLQNANGSSQLLRLFSITTDTNNNPQLNYNDDTQPFYVPVGNTPWADSDQDWSGFLPQPVPGLLVGTSPDSRTGSVVYRNGSLWCAQTIFLPATNPYYTVAQWCQINPETRSCRQSGRIGDQSNFCAFASLAVNYFEDVLIGYTATSYTNNPSGAYSFRAFTNALNEMQTTRIFKLGENAYDGRFGDYSVAAVDPADHSFWTHQEYGRADDPGTYTRWGTWWGQLKVELPTNDQFSAYLTLSGTQGTTNGTLVRATREAGEPNHAGSANTPSVWFRWTAPTNGNVAFSVTNNGIFTIDTALAIYTGTSIDALTEVASHHGGTQRSQVVFNATSNTTYQIAVAAWDKTYGDFALTWNQPTLPYFTLQPRGWDVYMGSDVTFSAGAIGVPTPTYQWRLNGVNIAGATTTTYTKNNVQTNDTADYTVVASNTSGSVTSIVAHLEVYSTQRALITEPGYFANSNCFRMIVSGITGAQYVVQASTNLINWVSISTNITTFTNLDYAITNFPYRFYRVLYVP